MIEINDKTHLQKARRERDAKVHEICYEAGIPIINLWTSYGVNRSYIKEKIEEALITPMTIIHPESPIKNNTNEKAKDILSGIGEILLFILKIVSVVFIVIPLKIIFAILDTFCSSRSSKKRKKRYRRKW